MSVIEREKTYSPLVFVNNPVNSPEQDIIGFDVQVETLEKAIDDGATMVGLIADYGTGKSSMTELLCNDFVKKGHPAPIRINMWDSLGQASRVRDSASVSDLTKSFLFQLANGKDSTLSRYINKILSKNYNNISFAVSNQCHCVCWAIASGILYGFYKMSSLSGTGIISAYPWVGSIAPIVKVLSPWFLVCSIAALLWGLRNASIAFSHWKPSGKREIEINDIFDTYRSITGKLMPKDGKKQLILIDDLDRINDKALVVSFLKELYRFQESMQKNERDKFVFIVSVMPESELLNKDSENNPTSELQPESNQETPEMDQHQQLEAAPLCVYPKVFDATLTLKPIHFDDYDSILLGLVTNDATKHRSLEKLIGERIQDSLPSSFRWIKNGTNLTLRDLKDRLNHAVAIMVSLKNKSHEGNSAADFKACAAVAFLESQYPNEYYRLVKSETEFAKFIRDSHKIVNEAELEEDTKELVTIFENYFGRETYGTSFIQALCGMVMEKTFNDDFRMYFYTYPKGSHIKTTEERELCNCLLFPNQYKIPENLDEYVDRAYKGGQNEEVEKILKARESFPLITIENGILLNHSVKVSVEKAFAVFAKKVIDSNESEKNLHMYWSRIKNIAEPLKSHFIRLCVNRVIALSDAEIIIQKRLEIIAGLRENVLDFKALYDGTDETPQITSEEIEHIANPDVFVPLISLNKVDEAQQEYLCASLNSVQLISHAQIWPKAVAIMKTLIDLVNHKDIAVDLLKFLQINRVQDEEIFSVVCAVDTSHQKLAEYLNSFDPNELSKEYLCLLDEIGFTSDIREDIVFALLNFGLFFTPILYYTKTNNLHRMDQFLEHQDKILEACSNVNEHNPETIISFRNHCLFNAKVEKLDALFFGDYPLITTDEYCLFESTSDAIHHINTIAIDNDSVAALLHIINAREYTPDELVDLFEYLFKPESNPNCITEPSTIKSLIDEIDFQYLHIEALSFEQRSRLFAAFSDQYVIDDSTKAIAFTQRLGCFVPEIETLISKDDDATANYCKLIAEMDELSDTTLIWLKKHYLIAPASSKISEVLFEKGWYVDYIITNILRENRMIMDARIDFSHYMEAYTDFEIVFDVMSDHWEFLEQLQRVADFEKLEEKHLVPMFKVPQIERFFSFIFSDKTSPELKKQYLWEFYKFKEETDSIAFQKLICQPENIKLVDSIELKDSIYQKLWETNPYHKGAFTKAWNKEWSEKLSLLQPV